ncbi:MAG: FAD-dependent oxidoreductase, partial [Polyangiaceae bacterium]
AQCEASRIALRVFWWDQAAENAGLALDAAYLVRPDGYVAWADPEADAGGLARYLAKWSLR